MLSWGLALLLSLLSATGPARAQDAAREAEYAQLIEDALREYQAGRWEEAFSLFERAHALRPSARTLRGMGLSAFENRRYAIAVVRSRAALAEQRNPLTGGQRQEMEDVLRRAAGFVARLQLTLAPQTARFTIDGVAPLRDESGEWLIDPGEHELIAFAPGHVQERRQLSASSGKSAQLAISLRPDSGARTASTNTNANADGAAAGLLATDGAGSQPHDGSGSSLPPVLIYGGVALAGAGVIAGTVTGAWAASNAGELKSACQGDVCPEAERDRLDQTDTLATVSTVSFAVAAGGLACALIGLLIDDGGDTESAAAARARGPLAPGARAIALRGSF